MNQAKILNNFNSIKVRLEQTSDTFGAVQDINFNSIKVRLEHPEAIDDMFNMNHFNSIKVRLELLE